MIFAIDKGSLSALGTKGHKLTFDSGDGLIIDEDKGKEESIIEQRMASAHIDDDKPTTAMEQ